MQLKDNFTTTGVFFVVLEPLFLMIIVLKYTVSVCSSYKYTIFEEEKSMLAIQNPLTVMVSKIILLPV